MSSVPLVLMSSLLASTGPSIGMLPWLLAGGNGSMPSATRSSCVTLVVAVASTTVPALLTIPCAGVPLGLKCAELMMWMFGHGYSVLWFAL